MTRHTASPAREAAEALLSLLRRQAALCEKLESLADQQRHLVAREDVGALLILLEKRGELSKQLTELDGGLRPIRQDWQTHRACLSPVQRVEADRLLSESSERLKGVMEGDERDARILSGRKHTIAAALGTVNRAGEAMSAYRAPVGGGGSSYRMDEGI